MPVKKIKAKKPAAKKPVAKKPVKKVVVKKVVKKISAKKPVKPVKFVAKKAVKKPTVKQFKPVKKVTVKPKEKSKKDRPKKEVKLLTKNPKIEEQNKKEVKLPKESKVKELKPVKEVKLSENTPKKTSDNSSKNNFKIGEYAVYPSHGVGKITGVETNKILGQDFSFYLMYFEKEKLVVKIPVINAQKIGLRALASKAQLDEVFSILRSGVKKMKGMWSRRAQEYETKINSGDIFLLAEVLRDLIRDIEDGDRSYSERIIYETAINRLASEYAAVHGVDFEEARQKVVTIARDKLVSEIKVAPKDEFDDFDADPEDLDEEVDEEDEEEEDEDDDYDDDEDDDKPKRKRK